MITLDNKRLSSAAIWHVPAFGSHALRARPWPPPFIPVRPVCMAGVFTGVGKGPKTPLRTGSRGMAHGEDRFAVIYMCVARVGVVRPSVFVVSVGIA